MKRFTDNRKWDDSWFWDLSDRAKLLWLYLLDHCDNAGIIDFRPKISGFKIGKPIEAHHLAELDSRVNKLKSGKLWIPKFVNFQFGSLEPSSNIHRSVLKLIQSHGLNYPQDFQNAMMGSASHHDPIPPSADGTKTGKGTRQGEEQEKEKEKEKETEEEKEESGRVQGGGYHKDSRTALHWLNEKSGKRFRETDTNLGFVSQRLSEPEVSIEGVKKMIDRQCLRWKGTSQAEYLRPETIFNKTKFDGYYAAREQPIQNGDGKHQPERNQLHEHIDIKTL